MYIPKQIRGQKYKGYIKLSISQVERLFRDGQHFNGFIVGNKVNTHHFFGGWHLACTIEHETWDEFKASINHFLFYLDSELGDNAAIYRKIPVVQYGKRKLGEKITPVIHVKPNGELITLDGSSIQERLKQWMKNWNRTELMSVSICANEWLEKIEEESLLYKSRGA